MRFYHILTSFHHRVYGKKYTKIIRRLKIMWVLQNRSVKFADELRNVFRILFKLPGDTRWNSLMDAIKMVLRKYGTSRESFENFNKNIDAVNARGKFKTKLENFEYMDIVFLHEFYKVGLGFFLWLTGS